MRCGLGRVGVCHRHCLVRVHADGVFAVFGGRFKDALARAAGDLEDDVGALAVLGLGQFLALGRVIPTVGKLADDLDVRVRVLGALFVADHEVENDRDLLAADRADDGVGVHAVKLLRGHGGGIDTRQVRAFVLLVEHRVDVGALVLTRLVVGRIVKEDKANVRVLRGDPLDVLDHVGGAEHDDVVVAIGQGVDQGRLPLRRIIGRLDRVGLDAEFAHSTIDAALGRVEERLVAKRAVDEEQDLERFACRRCCRLAGGGFCGSFCSGAGSRGGRRAGWCSARSEQAWQRATRAKAQQVVCVSWVGLQKGKGWIVRL